MRQDLFSPGTGGQWWVVVGFWWWMVDRRGGQDIGVGGEGGPTPPPPGRLFKSSWQLSVPFLGRKTPPTPRPHPHPSLLSCIPWFKNVFSSISYSLMC